MAFVRSLRDIPLDQEPHASVLAALLPLYSDQENVDWSQVSAYQLAHLQKCPACAAVVGGIGKVCLTGLCTGSAAQKAV